MRTFQFGIGAILLLTVVCAAVVFAWTSQAAWVSDGNYERIKLARAIALAVASSLPLFVASTRLQKLLGIEHRLGSDPQARSFSLLIGLIVVILLAVPCMIADIWPLHGQSP